MRPLSLLAVAILASCARPPELAERFPIGLYNVKDPAVLPHVLNEGFNAIQTYDLDPSTLLRLDSAARRHGLMLLAHPQGVMASTFPASAYSSTLWYLVDEPDVNNMPPERLQELDAQVEKWAPGTKTTFVVGDGTKAAPYAASGDALMVDWYPVPHRPLESLGEHVGTVVAVSSGKPVWAVIQAFDWKDYPQGSPGKPRIGRFPNIREMRFMSYDAVLQGARGLWYFSYGHPKGGTLHDTPELWFALTSVTREMSAMALIFSRGKDVALPFTPKPGGVAARAWRWLGRDYVVIMNRTGDLKLKVPEVLLGSHWRPLFTPRRDARESLDSYHGAYYLRPYSLLVFERRIWPFG